jgi:putative endonuclease
MSCADAARHLLLRSRIDPRHARGRYAEDLAMRYLQRKGWHIVARNWRPMPMCEVDLIAMDGELTIFVEVKSRLDDEHGDPERLINALKIVEQRRAADAWARRARIAADTIRFDLITVLMERPVRIQHTEGAWSLRSDVR